MAAWFSGRMKREGVLRGFPALVMVLVVLLVPGAVAPAQEGGAGVRKLTPEAVAGYLEAAAAGGVGEEVAGRLKELYQEAAVELDAVGNAREAMGRFLAAQEAAWDAWFETEHLTGH